MPSPIAHTAAGYVMFQVARRYWPARPNTPAPRTLTLLVGALAFSMLPDLDAVLGILVGDLGRFHNQGLHSLLVGCLIAIVVGIVARVSGRRDALAWSLLALAGFSAHVMMDFFTRGRGVMLFWPLTDERFLSPFSLFYGLRWSHGLVSASHLWTIFTEGVFSAGMALLVHAALRIPLRLQWTWQTLRGSLWSR
jgi:inner membrane protein